MRPAKRILIVDDNDIRISLLRMLLWARKFNVEVACGLPEARAAAECHAPDVVILRAPSPGIDLGGALKAIKALDTRIPVLLLARPCAQITQLFCDVTLDEKISAAELIERLKVLAARKPGPRKGFNRKPVGAVAADDVVSRRIA